MSVYLNGLGSQDSYFVHGGYHSIVSPCEFLSALFKDRLKLWVSCEIHHSSSRFYYIMYIEREGTFATVSSPVSVWSFATGNRLVLSCD